MGVFPYSRLGTRGIGGVMWGYDKKSYLRMTKNIPSHYTG